MQGPPGSSEHSDPAPEAIAGQLHRILHSSRFAQAEGLARFLRFAVETALEGKSGQIKETTLGIEVFGRGLDFDPRVDPIVRVQARRLRSHLAAYYGAEGRADPILIGIPKGSYAPVFQFRAVPPAPGAWTDKLRSRLGWRLAVLVSTVAVVLPGAAWWFVRRASNVREPRIAFQALTFDAGLTAFPALSPNGSLVAFASDRSGRGDLDLYVAPAAGGEPVRLTTHEADDCDPAFSPDGNLLAFRSERNGGGVYVMSALSGESEDPPRLLVQGGRRPRFSPDGQWIAYWSGRRHFGGRTFVIPARGGEPKEIAPMFRAARDPIWMPDGKSLLLLAQGPQDHSGDWWVAPLDGGFPSRTGVADEADRLGLRHTDETGAPQLTDEFAPGGWVRGGNEVTVASPQGEGVSLLRVKLSPPSWRVSGIENVTQGPGFHAHPTGVAAGTLAFSQLNAATDIWLLRGDPSRRGFESEPHRLTDERTYSVLRSASADGRAIVYHRMRRGAWQTYFRRLAGGPAGRLVESPTDPLRVYPLPRLMYSLSPDGSSVAYGANEGNRHAIYSAATAGGAAARVCLGCSGPWDWSRDGRILYAGPSGREQQYTIGLIHPGTRARAEMRLSLPHLVWDFKISPDMKWVAVLASTGVDTRQVLLAPFRPGESLSGRHCVGITAGDGMDVTPRWSPDGRQLYFLSERDGFRCIWVQRVDPDRGQPVGDPEPVRHFHEARRSLSNVGNPGWNGLTVTRDGILFVLGEMTGNVWLARLP